MKKINLILLSLFLSVVLKSQILIPFYQLPLVYSMDTSNDRIFYLHWNGSTWINEVMTLGTFSKLLPVTGGGSGTVTNVTTGRGLIGGPITNSGTIKPDTSIRTGLATNRYADSIANVKQNALTLTTTGTSGDATLTGSVLNIPNYASGNVNLNDTIGGSGSNPIFATQYGISNKQNIMPTWSSYGNVSNNDFTSGDYTTNINNGATAIFSSNGISISGGAASPGYAYVLYNKVFDCTEYWTMSARIKINATPSSTTYDFTLIHKSTNKTTWQNASPACTFLTSSGSNLGKLQFFTDTTFGTNPVISSTGISSLAVGDIVYIAFSKFKDIYICDAYDSNRNAEVQIFYNENVYGHPNYTYDVVPHYASNSGAATQQGEYIDNTGQFGFIVAGSSSFFVSQLKYQVNSPVNPCVYITGTSWGQGFGAGDIRYAIMQQLGAYNGNKFVINGGTGDKTKDALCDTTLGKLINPKCVIIWGPQFCSVVAGESVANITADLDTLYNAYVRGGATVYIATMPDILGYQSTINSVNSNIISRYPNNYIDLNTDFTNTTINGLYQYYSAGDHIHMNAQGYMHVAQKIINKVAPFLK